MQETIWMQGSTAGRLNLMYHLKRLPCRSSSTDVSMRSYKKAAEKKTLYVQAVKMSEDEKNIIIRLSEQDGTRGKLVLPFAVQPVNLLEDSEGERTDVIVYHPFELVSFAIPVLPE